jgi:RNA polymerase sigma factor (sigma-70 family)
VRLIYTRPYPDWPVVRPISKENPRKHTVTHAKHNLTDRSGEATLAGRAFKQHATRLLRFLMRCRGCEQEADDLAQEVYLQLLLVKEAEAVRQPQAYMYRIAAHVVYRFKERKRRESDLVTFDLQAVDQLQEQPETEAGDNAEEHLDMERELDRLLAQLPPLYQAIILMRKRDGLSYAQVAEQLDISVHTVKKYLHRALVQLRHVGWDR